jgi:hypothetical protein
MRNHRPEFVNAVLHSLSRVGTFTVRCELFSTYVWIEVEDEGGDWCRPDPDGRPHGLDVSPLAGEGHWGIEPTRRGSGLCGHAWSFQCQFAKLPMITRFHERIPVRSIYGTFTAERSRGCCDLCPAKQEPARIVG